jgi:hypothetical protein
MSTPLAAFGPGICIVKRTDIANGPSVNIGFAQELSLDSAATNKELYGQNKFPLVVAQGTIKVTGKIKAAVLSGLAWNAVMFAQSFTSGGVIWNVGEAQAVPATPYTVTVTNAATFDSDLGVTYAATGLPFQRVTAGSEAVGLYSVTETGANKGKYVFAVADTLANVKITYRSTTASGQTLSVQNQVIGNTPTFQLDYWTNLNQPTSKPFAYRLYACVASKLTIASKLEDYILPELDFSVFANNAGNVYDFIYPEVS